MLNISSSSPHHCHFLQGIWRIAITMVMAMALLSSCVERYHPDDLYLKEGLLVINAHITDEPGIQTIEISRSSHPEAPSFNPELDCFVLLLREDGESREFHSSEQPGLYIADLDTDFLRPGMPCQMQVFTLDGNEYHSDFDEIRPVPAIDSIYYKVEYMNYIGEEDPHCPESQEYATDEDLKYSVSRL